MRFQRLAAVFLAAIGVSCGPSKASRQPVIDVHLHSESLENLRIWGWNPVTGKKAPESVEEHIAAHFLKRGGLVFVSAIENMREKRFGFSFWRVDESCALPKPAK